MQVLTASASGSLAVLLIGLAALRGKLPRKTLLLLAVVGCGISLSAACVFAFVLWIESAAAGAILGALSGISYVGVCALVPTLKRRSRGRAAAAGRALRVAGALLIATSLAQLANHVSPVAVHDVLATLGLLGVLGPQRLALRAFLVLAAAGTTSVLAGLAIARADATRVSLVGSVASIQKRAGRLGHEYLFFLEREGDGAKASAERVCYIGPLGRTGFLDEDDFVRVLGRESPDLVLLAHTIEVLEPRSHDVVIRRVSRDRWAVWNERLQFADAAARVVLFALAIAFVLWFAVSSGEDFLRRITNG